METEPTDESEAAARERRGSVIAFSFVVLSERQALIYEYARPAFLATRQNP